MIKKLYYNIRRSWFGELRRNISELRENIALSSITSNYAEIELAERLNDPIRLERFGYKVYS